MHWTSWGLLSLVSLGAGATGAFVYAHRAALQRTMAPYRCRLERYLQAAMPRRRPALPVAPRPKPRPTEDAVVLMPDGRPCPLGPAVQILEIAWRWQVVHGANLPIRARQGEGAYVWRPPLPRGSSEQPGAEVER